jgi:hypothetical protein
MKHLLKLLIALTLSMCALNGRAFVPFTYSRDISVHFEQGKFELSDYEKARLIKLIQHWEDLVVVKTFLVLAQGDEVSDDTNRDFQGRLARARADAINNFYAEHAPPQLHDLLGTYTEPIKNEKEKDKAGSAEVVIQGFCKPGNYEACNKDWPPRRPAGSD